MKFQQIKIFNEDLRFWWEAGYVVLAASVLPFEKILPTVMSKSIPAILTLIGSLYLLIFRRNLFTKILCSKEILIGVIFAAVCIAIESFRLYRIFDFPVRSFEMVIGIAVFATILVSSKRHTITFLVALVIAGCVTTIVLSSAFIALLHATSGSYSESSEIRHMAFKHADIGMNLNELSIFLVFAFAAAMALAFHCQTIASRIFYIAIAGVIAAASVLLISRSGMVGLAMTGVGMIITQRQYRRTMIISCLIIGVILVFFSPEVVTKRISLGGGEIEFGKLEARERVYDAAIESFPEYFWLGVGEKNFWDGWGYAHGFKSVWGVVGPHNVIAQIWINYGIIPVLIFFIWMGTYGKILWDLRCRPDAFFLFSAGIMLFLLIMFSHTFYAKVFSLGFGIILAEGRRAVNV